MKTLSTATPVRTKLSKPRPGPAPRAAEAIYNAIAHERRAVERQTAEQRDARVVATLRGRVETLKRPTADALRVAA